MQNIWWSQNLLRFFTMLQTLLGLWGKTKGSEQRLTGPICVFITSWGFVVLCHRHDFLLTIPWTFSKAVIFRKLGGKKKAPKAVQLWNSAINRRLTLQIPLTFLLGGVTDPYLVKLSAVALTLYLSLLQTSRKPCIPENLPAFPSFTENPVFLMLLCFHDITTIFQEDIYFPNSQSLIYSHSTLYQRKVGRALLMSQDTVILILNSWEMILHGRGQVLFKLCLIFSCGLMFRNSLSNNMGQLTYLPWVVAFWFWVFFPSLFFKSHIHWGTKVTIWNWETKQLPA